jgi:hypothetical protein
MLYFECVSYLAAIEAHLFTVSKISLSASVVHGCVLLFLRRVRKIRLAK